MMRIREETAVILRIALPVFHNVIVEIRFVFKLRALVLDALIELIHIGNKRKHFILQLAESAGKRLRKSLYLLDKRLRVLF